MDGSNRKTPPRGATEGRVAMSIGVASWLAAMILFCLWCAAMITGESAGGLIHLLLGLAIGIVMVRILVHQRRPR